MVLVPARTPRPELAPLGSGYRSAPTRTPRVSGRGNISAALVKPFQQRRRDGAREKRVEPISVHTVGSVPVDDHPYRPEPIVNHRELPVGVEGQGRESQRIAAAFATDVPGP